MVHFTIPAGTTIVDENSLDGWRVDRKTLETVTIPASVESIGDSAFFKCSALVDVDIPEGVKSIGKNAFLGCRALVEVLIPTSVKSVGPGAFFKCSALVAVNIPEGVKSININTFFDCSALVEVNIPISVELIGERAFYGCSTLVKVKIPSSVKSIERCAFDRCNSDLVIDFGLITKESIGAPNRFPEINNITRAASLEKDLGDAGRCIVQHVWPASTVALTPPKSGILKTNSTLTTGRMKRPRTYAATEPEPGLSTLVDGTKIVLLLQTLEGNAYEVYGCWGKDRVFHPDFKQLAAEQHPDELGDRDTWDVLLYNEDVVTHMLDLAEVGNAIANGDFDPRAPILIVWTEQSGPNSTESSSAVATTSDKSKRLKARMSLCDACC
jgi:hypothetical protein